MMCLDFKHLSWLHAFLARWVVLTFAWCFFNFIPVWIGELADSRLSRFLIGYFSGPMYQPWAIWFIDYYWLAFSLAGPLYFFDQRDRFTLKNDKYQALLVFVFQFLLRYRGIRVNWSPLVRLGLLTVLLKLFFIPYIVTWFAGNLSNLWQAMHPIQWNFRSINHLLIEGFLFTDVAIFGFGYFIESNRLGSEIKSVDPTWIGWLACLWCYPPFNSFSFLPFDVALFPIKIETSDIARVCFNILESVLWGIFAWSSLALGFKASNLTARGIVHHGPYRWVRHPAYAAKLGVWWIQGVIFGEFTIGILLAFTVIYGLRAWTEERHLSSVDNYLDYCQDVHWRFIPGLV